MNRLPSNLPSLSPRELREGRRAREFFRNRRGALGIGMGIGIGPFGGGGSAAPDALQSNLAGSWLLNESSGNRADSGPNGLTATDNNTVGFGIGRFSRCGRFLATSDEFLSVADNAALDFTTAFTASCWAYGQTLAANGTLFAKFAEDNSSGFAVELTNTDELLVFINGASAYAETSGLNLLPKHLYHVAIVYDGSLTGNANRLKLYVNGAQVALSFTGTVPATLTNNSAAFRIGSISAALGRFWNGNISDVLLRSVAQDAAAIARLWNGGLGRRVTASAVTAGVKTGNIVFFGDSMTRGFQQSSPIYAEQVMELVNTGGVYYDYANYGADSRETSHIIAAWPTEGATYAAASPKTAVIWIGRNDCYSDGGAHLGISGELAWAGVEDIVDLAAGDDYDEILVVNMLPAADLSEARRSAFNALAAAGAGYTLVDIAADDDMGDAGDETGAYYGADDIHISDLGATRLAATVAAVIQGLP